MQIRDEGSGKPLCFVIMPFQDMFNEYYNEIIKPAVEDAGMSVRRADEVLGPGAFMEDIVNGILEARCLIADVTGRNANVFYELGLSHGFRKPVIMVTQNELDVPSDLKSMKWILYRPVAVHWGAELRKKLTMTLIAMLEQGDRQLMFPFIHPSSLARRSALGLNILDLTGTQKQFLDYIHQVGGGPVNQRNVERRFSLFPTPEVFYRLEHLRLLGFLSSLKVDQDSSGKPIYAYSLSAEARELLSMSKSNT
jgi:hypothetical protein